MLRTRLRNSLPSQVNQHRRLSPGLPSTRRPAPAGQASDPEEGRRDRCVRVEKGARKAGGLVWGLDGTGLGQNTVHLTRMGGASILGPVVGSTVDVSGSQGLPWEGEGLAGGMDISINRQLSGLHSALGPPKGDGGGRGQTGTGRRSAVWEGTGRSQRVVRWKPGRWVGARGAGEPATDV